jgi:hypothetical protein
MCCCINRYPTGEWKEKKDRPGKEQQGDHAPIPWDSNVSMDTVMGWINSGAIGDLSEVHNWSNRPLWPQFPTLPEDRPAAPPGFGLGPNGWVLEADRPLSPTIPKCVQGLVRLRRWINGGHGPLQPLVRVHALQLKISNDHRAEPEPCLWHA